MAEEEVGPPPGKRLLGRAAIAERTGVPIGTVRRITESGELRSRKVGHKVMATEGDVDAWLDLNRGTYAPKASAS